MNFKHFNLDDATMFDKKDIKIVVYIVIYVDDFLMIGNNEIYIASIKKKFKRVLICKFGISYYHLGIEVTQYPKYIVIS